MPWGAAIGAVAGLAGSAMQAGAAGDAADAQAEAARLSDETQRYFYDTNRKDNEPFRVNGTAANNRLAYLLGIGGTATQPVDPYAGQYGQSNGLTAEQLRNALLPQYTRTNEFGDERYGGEGIGFYRDAPTTTIDEVGLNAEIQRRIGPAQTPAALPDPNADPAYGSLLRSISRSDIESDPVYSMGLEFGLNEGTKGINRQAAASGQALSGATLKALSRYGNDYATTKAGDAFNRVNNQKQQTFNMLSGVSGTGQVANSQVGQSGMNAANNISASQQGVGNARAASAIGQANAWSGGLANGVNAYQNQQYMNKLFPQSGSNSGWGAGGAWGNEDLGSYY